MKVPTIELELNAHTRLEQLAKACVNQSSQMRIGLQGDLGTGKTTFVQCLLRALGVDGPIQSPTYTYFSTYTTPVGQALHADLYRLTSPEEVLPLDLEYWMAQCHLSAIEWPTHAGKYLPPLDLTLHFYHEHQRRWLTYEAHTERGMML